MAAKPWNPRLPTVYLDQSTLSAAFRAFRPEDPQTSASYLHLAQWIEQICENVNVCISLAHVLELASTGAAGTHWNIAHAKKMATWLDGLPLVWTAFVPKVRADEAIYWL